MDHERTRNHATPGNPDKQRMRIAGVLCLALASLIAACQSIAQAEPACAPPPAAESSGEKMASETFFRAIIANDLPTVQEAFTGGFDPNQLDRYGNAALHWAAALDHVELINLLLRCGASPDIRARQTEATPLLLAIDNEATHAMLPLLEARSDLTARVSVRELNREQTLSAIDLAARRNRIDAIHLLIEHGADVAKLSSRAVAYAMAQRNPDLMELLLEHGADDPALHASSYSYVNQAVESGNIEILEVLVAHGAQPSDAAMALSAAARHRDPRMLTTLLALDLDVNGFGNGGETPLMAAAGSANLTAIETLLQHGAQPLAVMQNNQPPLEMQLPPTAIDIARTALSFAAGSGSVDAVKQLAALPGFTCDMFGAALVAATSLADDKGRPAAEFLLENKACFAAGSDALRAALLRAVDAQSIETVKVLLTAGASLKPSIDSKYSSPIYEPLNPPPPDAPLFRPRGPRRFVGYAAVSPLQFAIARRDLELTRLLVQAGASVTGDIQRMTAFHVLSSYIPFVVSRMSAKPTDNPDALIAYLLAVGVDVNAADASGTTPLMQAAANGDLALVRALLSAGANPQLRNAQRRDAAAFAEGTRHPGTARFLRKQISFEEAQAMDAADKVVAKPRDELSEALCIARPTAEEPFSIGRTGVAAHRPKLPFTPFAGQLAVEVSLDVSASGAPVADRKGLQAEVLYALATWRRVCPSCAPRNLAVARIDGAAFMVEECYREIRDLPNRGANRRIPRLGDPVILNPDESASCGRRYGALRGVPTDQWQFVALAANDPVIETACAAPEYADIAVALHCGKDDADQAPIAQVTIGLTNQATACRGPQEKVIACTRQHRRVDLNTRDFKFVSKKAAVSVGGGASDVDLSLVMLHEVGHWLGLDDDDSAEGNIMSPRISSVRCISNKNLAALSDPLSQVPSLHDGAVEALMNDR